MAEIYVTNTADSGEGSLRQALVDAQDGDVILFDPAIFPVGQTTAIYLSSYLQIDKSVSIYGGFNDGNGGYTSGATKRFYVYRENEGVKTKVYISDDNSTTEGETLLFENVCRVALDGQGTGRCAMTTARSADAIVVSGLCLQNGYVNGPAAGFYAINDAPVVLTDCAIKDSIVTSNGCGIFFSNTNGNTLSGCSITNCNAGSGGGYYAGNVAVNIISDCCFDSCSATSYGGAILASNSAQQVFNNCTIYGCSASSGGGVYARDTSKNTLNDCIFDGCSASQYDGGGVCSLGTSQNTLSNCTLVNCTAERYGGGIRSTVSPENNLNWCVFDNCTSVGGGAIYMGDTSKYICNNCSIVNCAAGAGGGIETALNSIAELNNCVISNCNAISSTGGALYATNSCNVTINDCRFSDCTSVIYGGGVCLTTSASVSLNNCIISGCTSIGSNGGGVYTANTTIININNCQISECNAKNYGGGVFLSGDGQGAVNDCVITQNIANNGGGLCTYNNATANINNCIIKDNITTSTDQTQKDVSIISTSFGNITASEFGALRISEKATVTFVSGVTTAQTARFLRQNATSPTITINDGAALSFTESATISEESVFISEGRGYLAVAPGINTSLATFENVVLCAYGADVSSFAEVDGVLKWDADDPSVSVLLEREDNDAWTTLAQTTGESLDYYLPPKVNLRLFDGERFLTTATPDSRTYFYIGGAEGSFDDAEDWSLTKDGTAIPQSPTITDCAFVIQGAEGDVAISKGSANVTNATIIPAGTNDIAVTVDEATVLAGTERFTGTLTTTGDVAITGDASKLAIVVDGTLEVAGSLKLATLTLTSGSSVVFASADDVLVVTDSATVNDATFSCEEPTAYFTAPVGTDLTQATFTNVYVATKGAEVVSVTGSRFGKNYSINIVSEDNTLPVTVEYRLEGTNEWIVADPAFVGSTFQIRLDDEATFRVYNGEKFTEATMKVYGLYNEMAAIVEIGYLI